MRRLLSAVNGVRVRAGVRCPVADDHLFECLSLRRLPRASYGCAARTLQARKARPVRPAPPPLQRLRLSTEPFGCGCVFVNVSRTRVLQPRLEELVSRRSAIGAAAWRQLFKFLELPQVNHDLTAIGQRAVSELELRGRVRNSAAPGWVHSTITGNASMTQWLRRMRRDLEYAKGGGSALGGTGLATLAGTPAASLGAAAPGRQLDTDLGPRR